MKRIGLLGGTFNPIHIGHLVMAQVALEQMELDKVIFVPSNLPPHKTSKNLCSAKHRLNMVRLAIKGTKFFEVSDVEIKRGGKSYSVETIKCFSAKDKKLFFILGQDAFSGLNKWKNVSELVKLTSFIVLNRPGVRARKGRYKHKALIMPNIEIASSYLRNIVRKDKSIKHLVPDNVRAYIQRHKLYRK